MHLTPENAPVGAVVAVHNGMAEKVIKIRQWDEGHFRAIWPGGMRWSACDDFQFVRRIDQPEPMKPSPDRLDAWPTVDDVSSERVAGEWKYESSTQWRSGIWRGYFTMRPVFVTTRGETVGSEIVQGEFETGEYFTRVQPLPATPGDGVTLEQDSREGERFHNEETLFRAYRASLVRLSEMATGKPAPQGAPLDALEQTILVELSALRDLRRASERLPGEGDAVEWKPLPADFGQGNTAGSPGYSRGFGWCMLSDGARVSEFFQPPHPDLHPVRVDGVWRWVRKEKA